MTLASETRTLSAAKQKAWLAIESLGPGLAVVAGVTAIAMLIHALAPAVSIGLIAVGIGLAAGNSIALPETVLPGITFAMKKLLRFSVMMLGLQISIAEIASLGLEVLAVVILTLIATLIATIILGRALGVDPKLARLLACGTSVCGASAVLAANEAVQGTDKHATYAVCMVTIFGTLAMFLFPILGQAAGLSNEQFGLWSGAAIHEVAQAVGSAFQFGDQAGKIGTIAKLTRVLCLAPVIFAFLFFPVSKTQSGKNSAMKVPWFVTGFIVMVAINSLLPLPKMGLDVAKTVTITFLAAALAAMGLETRFHALWREGWKPMVLAASASVFIASAAFLVIVFFR